MKHLSLITLLALSLLSACSEDAKDKQQSADVEKHKSTAALQSAEQTQSQTTISSNPLDAKQTIEQATKAIGDALQQQQNQLNQALDELTVTLDEAGNAYEKSLELNEENVEKLAEKVGKLAYQAGQSARTLEKTGKTLGEAIKKGFNEGYQKNQTDKKNPQTAP